MLTRDEEARRGNILRRNTQREMEGEGVGGYLGNSKKKERDREMVI